MSAHNRSIIEKINDVYVDITFKKIPNKVFASYIGMNEKTFSDRLDNDNAKFNSEQLAMIYDGLIGDAKKYNKVQKLENGYEKAAQVLYDIFIPQQIDEENYFAKKLSYETRIKIKQLKNSSNNKYFAWLSSAAIAPIIIEKQSDLSSYLPELFSKDSVIKILNLIVAKESIADTIQVIEQWAYGREGYAKPLKLNVFEREGEPIAEMVGGFIEGEFVAFMNHEEGYTLMSQLGHELLQDESDNLADEQPIWSLPHSPEARLIERLRRALIDTLPPDALAYLADKINAYESPEYQDTAAIGNELMASVVTELKNKYGDEVAITVQDTLDYFKLAAI